MNKDRRKLLQEAAALLQTAQEAFDQAKELIETAKDEEREYFDNMPESLQSSERGQLAEAAADALDEAYNSLDELDLDGVLSNLETAGE